MFAMIGKKVKFLTKELLIAVNSEAILSGRNRTLYPDKIEKLPELNFPIVFSMLHNDFEIRAAIMVGPHADALQQVWLDMPIEVFNKLPEVELP